MEIWVPLGRREPLATSTAGVAAVWMLQPSPGSTKVTRQSAASAAPVWITAGAGDAGMPYSAARRWTQEERPETAFLSICGLGQAAPIPILGCLRYFRAEFEQHLAGTCQAGRCSLVKAGQTAA